MSCSSRLTRPPTWQPSNYVRIFVDFNIGQYFGNSLIVTVVSIPWIYLVHPKGEDSGVG